MSFSSPGKTAVAVLFVCVFVATGVVFVSVEATYMGILNRDAVSATVTDYEMVDGGEGSAVEVTVQVRNPTSAAVELDAVQIAGFLSGESQPLFRQAARGLDSQTVKPGATTRVTFVLRPDDTTGAVRDAVVADRLVLSGVVSAQIGSKRFDISLDTATGKGGGETP